MDSFKIGQVVDNFRYHQEGVQFDIHNDGATMIVFFNRPDQFEVEQFKAGNRFEIRFTELYDVIMITAKIGNLNWIDAPYSPHLGKKCPNLTLPGNNQGLSLMLILVDTSTGEIKHIRLLGLSEKFTKDLFKAITSAKSKEFNRGAYIEGLDKIYSMYTTNQIVKMSNSYCKLS